MEAATSHSVMYHLLTVLEFSEGRRERAIAVAELLLEIALAGALARDARTTCSGRGHGLHGPGGSLPCAADRVLTEITALTVEPLLLGTASALYAASAVQELRPTHVDVVQQLAPDLDLVRALAVLNIARSRVRVAHAARARARAHARRNVAVRQAGLDRACAQLDVVMQTGFASGDTVSEPMLHGRILLQQQLALRHQNDALPCTDPPAPLDSPGPPKSKGALRGTECTGAQQVPEMPNV